MRYWALIIFFLASTTFIRGMEVSVSFAAFKSEQTTYLELYFYVMANSISFEEVNKGEGLLQASVEILVLIKQGEEIIQFDKSKLSSPLSKKRADFSDLKRLSVPPGSYTIEVEIIDANDAENSILLSEEIIILFEGEVQQSDIQLLASFEDSQESNALVKNGISMRPIPYHYYNRNYQKLSFYTEVYHETLDAEYYIIRYSIQKIKSNGTREEVIKLFKRRKVKAIDPILLQLDISKIESGDYVLAVSVVDGNQEVLSEKEAFFIRQNPEYDYLKSVEYESVPEEEKDFTQELDSMALKYALRSLVPVVPQNESEVLKIVISKSNLKAMRMFLYNYFENQFPDNPGFAYKKYLEVAKAVDKKYENGFGYGFESDRGFYFLKYGKPDDIRAVVDEPSAPPYEIWFYNKLTRTNQNNVKFIFYNPSLIENGHVLLHSTARGEWNNPKWEVMLYSNSGNEIQGGNPVDANTMQDNFGRQARRLYNDF